MISFKKMPLYSETIRDIENFFSSFFYASSRLYLSSPSSSMMIYCAGKVVEIGRGSASKTLLNIRAVSSEIFRA